MIHFPWNKDGSISSPDGFANEPRYETSICTFPALLENPLKKQQGMRNKQKASASKWPRICIYIYVFVHCIYMYVSCMYLCKSLLCRCICLYSTRIEFLFSPRQHAREQFARDCCPRFHFDSIYKLNPKNQAPKLLPSNPSGTCARLCVG